MNNGSDIFISEDSILIFYPQQIATYHQKYSYQRQ